MAYVPFDPSYTPIRTPAYVAAESWRINARRNWVGNAIDGGNQVMGNLITACACTDPAFGGQGFYSGDPMSLLVPTVASNGAPGVSSSDSDTAALIAAGTTFPLTPVDILTGTFGFPIRRDGRGWRRPRLPASEGRRRANAYPNSGPAFDTSRLVPPCPCFSNAVPVPITVPVVTPAPVLAACPAGYVKNILGDCDKVWTGVSGLGQADSSNVGGFLAILGLFGIVVWAVKK